MGADFSGLVTELNNTKGVNASVIAFIAGFGTRLDAAVAEAVAANDAADLTAITDLAAQFSAESSALAASIVTNP